MSSRTARAYPLFALVGCLCWSFSADAAPVIVSSERFIRNPMGASSSSTVPLKTATGLERFDESIDIAQVFDGHFDPATGRDSTVTAIARVGQTSDFVGAAMVVQGHAEAYFNDTHSQSPFPPPNNEVESVFDVRFVLEQLHEFEFIVRAETHGAAEFLLTLDGPDGEVVRYEGTVMDGDSEVRERGTVPAGLYRLRQTARAATPDVVAETTWMFQAQFVEQGVVIPLPPAVLSALPLVAGAAALHFRRHRIRS